MTGTKAEPSPVNQGGRRTDVSSLPASPKAGRKTTTHFSRDAPPFPPSSESSALFSSMHLRSAHDASRHRTSAQLSPGPPPTATTDENVVQNPSIHASPMSFSTQPPSCSAIRTARRCLHCRVATSFAQRAKHLGRGRDVRRCGIHRRGRVGRRRGRDSSRLGCLGGRCGPSRWCLCSRLGRGRASLGG